ncbi:MAG: pilus assembly PilX N-terminal domain-containing protein, partial [Candidatus Marinimicrobia bacterium]|nr:pilus assembly PilX N-terminal domain-containing protein [Candidatus Neomarinimicrobiota bacterium]
MLHSHKKGNALVDLIIAMIIMGLVSISVVGAYTSLMSMASNSFRNSQASWFGNSVMEIYSAKAFGDIIADNNFTLNDQFPGYTADITVTHKDIDLSTSTFDGGNEESQYKEIIVAANNVSDNSVTLKTIISAPKKFQQPGSPTDGDIVWFDDFELPPFDDLEERGYDIGANEVTWSIGTDGGANGDNYLTIIGQGSG